MLNWEEIVQDYIIKHSDKIRRVTKPLRDHFKINYFTYHKIDKRGKYTVLVDRPDWAEHYVDARFFQDDPYLRHPDGYQPGFCLFDSYGDGERICRVMKDGKEIFNLDTGLMLIEKTDDCVEFFGFAGMKADSGLNTLHLKRPGILKAFAKHFKANLNKTLLQMEEEAGSLLDLKGSDFFNVPVSTPCEESVASFLRDLGKEEDYAKFNSLSIREKECLTHLLRSKSAKETAVAINLSPRTVESYLENIKNKLSCHSKRELLFKATEFSDLGLI